MENIKWGIIGLGSIADKFAQDLTRVDNVELRAVASRSEDKALQFKKKFGASYHYTSYEDMLDRSDIDVVYIATPHNSHYQWSKMALEKGVAVCCEKPAAVNQVQLKELLELSRKNQVFYMEALWSRFLPSLIQVKEKMDEGALGKVNYLNVDFSFHMVNSLKDRVLNPELAGGALLDIGIYPVFLSYWLLGMPASITANALFHTSGVDIQTAITFTYPDAMSVMYCGFTSRSDMKARIYGTEKHIIMDEVWHESDGFKLGTEVDHFHYSAPKKGLGYYHEIEEVNKCLFSGKIESDMWSHQNSLDLVQLLDSIREEISLKYPFE